MNVEVLIGKNVINALTAIFLMAQKRWKSH